MVFIMKFNKKDSFTLDDKEYVIEDLLGEGGQGEVYLVSNGSEKLAFKYYKDIPSEDFKYNLRNNIKKGNISPDFLWPKNFVEFEDDTCGYLMDVRPKSFVSFVSYLTGKNRFKSQRLLLDWCIELAKSFKELHQKGFSYQDLNDGSFFLNPETGELLICDNDNITADKKSLGVLGKMRYMAPEIVREDKDRLTGERQMPDTHSDRFSLAIILFLALCLGNPFEGECLKKYPFVDEKAEYEMFGQNPIYIFNKNDSSNRPIRGYHTAVLNRYPKLPEYIKEAFHKTFTEGLSDRENSRTTEIEWLKLLCRYRDELITCDKCNTDFYYDLNSKDDKCPYCGKKIKSFCTIQVGKSIIYLEPGTSLYKFHLDKYSDEYNVEIGKVIQNKNNPSLWGIRLSLDRDVLIKDMSGTEKSVDKNGVIPIIDNLKIKFSDSTIGMIKLGGKKDER